MSFETPSLPEKITSSALRFRGELFKGATHVHALDELEIRYPDWQKSKERVEDGFMTNTGRFVSRIEAEKIANNNYKFPLFDIDAGEK